MPRHINRQYKCVLRFAIIIFLYCQYKRFFASLSLSFPSPCYYGTYYSLLLPDLWPRETLLRWIDGWILFPRICFSLIPTEVPSCCSLTLCFPHMYS